MKTAKIFIIAAFFFAIGFTGWKLQQSSKPEVPPPQFGVFQETITNKTPPPGPAPEGMVWIPGGRFSMGAADPFGNDRNMVGMQATRDSRPIHPVYVDGFWMDKTEVTNRQFARFVEETGFITVAERKPRPEDFPGAPPENLVAGSVVFAPPNYPVPLTNHFQWWSYVKGANWRQPFGPGSNLEGRFEQGGRKGRIIPYRWICR